MHQQDNPATAECPICGMPDGDCYNLCPNSALYYSPEQERMDEVNYGCDRYDGYGDPELNDPDWDYHYHTDDI